MNENETEVTHIIYPNATGFEYPDASVTVCTLPEKKDYVIELRVFSPDDTLPRAIHKIEEDGRVMTGIKVSEHGAIFLMIALQLELERNEVDWMSAVLSLESKLRSKAQEEGRISEI